MPGGVPASSDDGAHPAEQLSLELINALSAAVTTQSEPIAPFSATTHLTKPPLVEADLLGKRKAEADWSTALNPKRGRSSKEGRDWRFSGRASGGPRSGGQRGRGSGLDQGRGRSRARSRQRDERPGESRQRGDGYRGPPAQRTRPGGRPPPGPRALHEQRPGGARQRSFHHRGRMGRSGWSRRQQGLLPALILNRRTLLSRLGPVAVR